MIVGVSSVSGAPGVTTFATMAVALWPSRVKPLLIEADVSGASLTSRFPGMLQTEPTTVQLIAQCRHAMDEQTILHNAQQLPYGGDVVVAPNERTQGAEAVRALLGRSAELVSAMGERDVLVDLGRAHAAPTPPGALDGLYVLTRLDFVHVATLLHQLPLLTTMARTVSVVGVVAPKHSGSAAVDPEELALELEKRTDGVIGLAGVLGYDPASAAAWTIPGQTGRKLDRLGLTRQLRTVLKTTVSERGGSHERV